MELIQHVRIRDNARGTERTVPLAGAFRPPFQDFYMSNGHRIVSIFLELGMEREDVIDSALSQLIQIIDAIPDLEANDTSISPDLPPEIGDDE